MKSGRSNRLDSRTREIAIKALIGTKLVQNWALGELKAYRIDPDSPEGKRFMETRTRQLAERTVDNRA